MENGHLVIAAMGDPVLLRLGPLAIYWYSLAYLAGLVGGWMLLAAMLRRPQPPLSREQLGDLFYWVLVGVVLGGHIGFVAFYGRGDYLRHLWAIIIPPWRGMSFHGGALGVLAAVILFSRWQGLKWLRILDYIVVVQPVGQFFGRIANFFNGELWGAPTAAWWGVIFRGVDAVDTPRHPSQLYEAVLEGVLLFLILNLLFWKTEAGHRPGFLTGAFLLGYGVFRFLVEFVREPDPQLINLTGPLHMGQWLCLPMIALGVGLMLRAARRAPL